MTQALDFQLPMFLIGDDDGPLIRGDDDPLVCHMFRKQELAELFAAQLFDQVDEGGEPLAVFRYDSFQKLAASLVTMRDAGVADVVIDQPLNGAVGAHVNINNLITLFE